MSNPQLPSGVQPGTINGYRCDACGLHTFIVHVQDGVTPMFLACRAEGVEPDEATCKGRAVSLMYPDEPPPVRIVEAVAWEWYSPDPIELADLEPESREHVRKGGLLLRPLTDAGRAALRNGSPASGGDR